MFKGFRIVDIDGKEVELDYTSEFSGAFRVKADVLGQILPKKVNNIHTGWYIEVDKENLDTIFELQFTAVCNKLHQSYQILNPYIALDHTGEIILKLITPQTTCITLGKDHFFAECRILPIVRNIPKKDKIPQKPIDATPTPRPPNKNKKS